VTVALVIIAFSVIQSLLGVGLLVFGTPTLLLLGYGFPQTLAILLPASVTISLLQVYASRVPDRGFMRIFGLCSLLPLTATIAAVLLLDFDVNLNLAVAATLAIFTLLRLFPTLSDHVRGWVTQQPRTWLLLTGVVHGFSNLGGGLLTIFAASRSQNKEDIRGLISFCYSSFAAIQLSVLAILSPESFSWLQVGYAALAGTVFVLVGQNVFRWISARQYDHLLTFFMATYAGLLGLRVAGIL
jgi:uncharacterized protein